MKAAKKRHTAAHASAPAAAVAARAEGAAGSWSAWYRPALMSALLTLAVYLPALGNGFVSLDDYLYVVDNDRIRSLGPEFFRWAFTDLSAGFWHPITWLSYALDYAVWGLNPLGYHLSAALLHALNTFLVFHAVRLLLEAGRSAAGRDMVRAGQGEAAPAAAGAPAVAGVAAIPEAGGADLVAGFTALLFGLHPLHVESVAWVSERKDLLCGTFYLLSLAAYLRWRLAARQVKASGRADAPAPTPFYRDVLYLLCLVFFLLALASKTMAVSLPVVLLILDWYPLRRWNSGREVFGLLLEKAPFLAAGLAIALTSVFAQSAIGALGMMASKPLPMRIYVAFHSLVAYLVQMVLPIDLVPLYPFPLEISFSSPLYLAAIGATLGLTLWAVYLARRQRLWLSLWSYYLVTLLPVLGIVQVGVHARADRFTYLPSLAPFLLAGLALERLSSGALGSSARQLARPVALLCLVALALLTVRQIGVWKSTSTLWNHTVEHGPRGNSSAYSNRGLMFKDAGQLDRAIEDYTTAISLEPSEAAYYVNRAAALGEKGELDRALADLDRALALKPAEYLAYNNRGNILFRKGAVERSLEDFNRAIALKPAEFLGYYNRAAVYEARGELDRAIEDYGRVISLKPGLGAAYLERGNLYLKKGTTEAAAADFEKGCRAGSNEACQAAGRVGRR